MNTTHAVLKIGDLCLLKKIFYPSAPQCVAWYSVDKPFAVGYPDGKILLAAAESYETDPSILLTAFPVSVNCKSSKL